MNKLTADDKKKLTTGLIVAAIAGFAAFRFFQSDGVFASAGESYSTPLGTGSLGQIVMSLLISVGGAVLTIGADLLKKWLGFTAGPGAEAIDLGRDKLLELLQRLAAERLAARDEEGYRLVYELHDHCLTCDPEKPPAVAPKP